MASKYLVVEDNTKKLLDALQALPGASVLVGIPEAEAQRLPEPGEPQTMNNAALGYVHEFGSPANNIPARPFLIPAVRETRERVQHYLKQAAQFALGGDKLRMTKALHAAGMVAASKAKSIITAGIAPPLSDRTLQARARRKAGRGHRINKGAVAELEARAKGLAPSTVNAKPLIDTAQMLNSITYVVRGS